MFSILIIFTFALFIKIMSCELLYEMILRYLINSIVAKIK